LARKNAKEARKLQKSIEQREAKVAHRESLLDADVMKVMEDREHAIKAAQGYNIARESKLQE
jgi:hypothetical protein